MKFLVFGGGGKVARHLARLGVEAGHQVIPIVRNDEHVADLKSLGAEPTILDLESAPVPDLTTLLTSQAPDVVVFAAGAGGKGDPSRTRKVDYDGAVKVYDAMEAANVRRLVLVGALDVRDRTKEVPEWYTTQDKESSDKGWGSIGSYMQAKYDAEVELHRRRAIAFTLIRPGGLTTEPAGGVTMGRTPISKTSRELVAKAIIAFAGRAETEGLTIDVIDGKGTVEGELQKVIDDRLDSWTG